MMDETFDWEKYIKIYDYLLLWIIFWWMVYAIVEWETWISINLIKIDFTLRNELECSESYYKYIALWLDEFYKYKSRFNILIFLIKDKNELR